MRRGLDSLDIRVTSEIDAAEARQEARRLALRHGFGTVRAHGFATAVSELAMNLALHTLRGGLIQLAVRAETTATVIEVVAEDEGPGIPDIALAMQDGYSTRGGLGCGLAGTRRLMDAFAMTSEDGRGTRIICEMRRS